MTQLGAFAIAAVRILPSISSMAVYMNNLIYFRPTVKATYQSLLDGVGSATRQSDALQMKGKQPDEDVEFQDRICIEHIDWKYADDLDHVLEDVSRRSCSVS